MSLPTKYVNSLQYTSFMLFTRTLQPWGADSKKKILVRKQNILNSLKNLKDTLKIISYIEILFKTI